MGDRSKIEWTEATWNPIRGCSKISEGCRFCYAERMAARFCGPDQPYEGLVHGGHWTGKVQLVPQHLQDPLRWRRPRRIFVNSMSDLFHEDLPVEQIDRVFGIMAAACDHTFQVLTKRAARMFDYLHQDRRAQWAVAGANGNDQVHDRIQLGPRALPNVWLGVSVEDQRAAAFRIPMLLQTPAAVRWLSCEPLLGPVSLLDAPRPTPFHRQPHGWPGWLRSHLHWVVCGGESGPDARPMHPDWVRRLRDECASLGVPFLFKQWGEFIPLGPEDPRFSQNLPMACPDWPGDEKVRLVRVGKKAAGRLLDGVLHDAYPEVHHAQG